MKVINGEENFTRIKEERSPYNKTVLRYDYNFNDPDTENHRKRENNVLLFHLAKELKYMKIEAINGFRDFSKIKQLRVIRERKEQTEPIIREYGSFLPDELANIIKRTNEIVDKIYKPNVRWARKKPRASYLSN